MRVKIHHRLSEFGKSKNDIDAVLDDRDQDPPFSASSAKDGAGPQCFTCWPNLGFNEFGFHQVFNDLTNTSP